MLGNSVHHTQLRQLYSTAMLAGAFVEIARFKSWKALGYFSNGGMQGAEGSRVKGQGRFTLWMGVPF